MKKEDVLQYLDEQQARYYAASDQVWDNPELRFALSKSVEAHYQVLEDEGFTVQKGIPNMKYAYIASYGQGSPVIGVLAEYDALSNLSQVADDAEPVALCANGNGHGCGHNLLGVGSIIGAVGIKEYLKANGISGTVRVYGCPAEEGGCGKTYMVRDGLFKDVDIAFCWHPSDMTDANGQTSLAVYHAFYHFKGVSAHAAAAPEKGRSALDAAELMNVGVQYLREHVIDSARIHYAYWDNGGKSPNVVQSSTTLFYYVRAPHMDQATAIFDRVTKVAQGAAMMTDTEVTLEIDSACSEYIANHVLTEVMHHNLETITPIPYSADDFAYADRYWDRLSDETKQNVRTRLMQKYTDRTAEQIEAIASRSLNPELMPLQFGNETGGSTDVSDVSWVVPTAQVNVACEPQGTPAHSWQWVANGKSSVAHKGMLVAGKAIALSGIDVLLDPSLIVKAKEELKQTVGPRGYVSPIPADIQPDE